MIGFADYLGTGALEMWLGGWNCLVWLGLPLTPGQDRDIIEGSGILGFRPQRNMLFDK